MLDNYSFILHPGMAVARDIKGKRDRVVAVISNETIMAGQVYEAMSNAGYLDSNMVVILNDSHHSLHPLHEQVPRTSINVISSTLSKLQSSKLFRKLRELAKVIAPFTNNSIMIYRCIGLCHAAEMPNFVNLIFKIPLGSKQTNIPDMLQ